MMHDDGVRRVRGATRSVALGLLVAGAMVIGCESGSGSRPIGTVEDIARLQDREDLNVLFILVDTLRADRLGSYGYERETSPNLDALAQTGVRFARHLSQSSWTKCSMASLWTSLYPIRSGVLRAQHAVAPDALLPAEIFREAGFRTAGIWRNGWIAPNFGFSQGFEIYQSPKPTPVPRSIRQQNPSVQVPGSDADIMRSAFEFLRVHTGDRWFLYLHMMDVHQYAHDEESALFGTGYTDIYDNSIHWVDGLLGHLLDELETLGLRKRTLIIFASDHGEAFGEHDGEGHARNVYGEVTQTPLILSFPFSLEGGIVVETRSENVDLWPTVLDLVGLGDLPDSDGDSLLPAIEAASRGETLEDGDLSFAHIDQAWARTRQDPLPNVSVTDGRWRLIHRAVQANHLELFDKTTDPREQRNLAAENPEVAARLKESVQDYLASPPPPWGSGATTIEIDDMQMQQLRAIGYGVQ